MSKIKCYIIVLALLSACSGEDAAEQVFNNVPAPGINTGTDNEESELSPQEVPETVPTISQSASYHGVLELSLDEAVSFSLKDSSPDAVVDLEFKAIESADLEFVQFSTSYQGDCGDWQRRMTWIEVDSQGEILDSYTLGMFDSWPVVSGQRYLLRILFEETQECSHFFNSIEITRR